MSDQNRLEEYRKKFLEYWGRFLALCGTLWGKIKENAGKAWRFLRHHGKALARKLAAFALKVREYAIRAADFLRRHGKKLLQLLAAWLLGIREKLGILWSRVRLWWAGVCEKLSGVKQRLLPGQAAQTLPEPEKPAALSAAEEVKPAELLPVPAEEPVEPVSEPVEAAPTKITVGGVFKAIAKWVRRLYKFVMAAPVVWAAVKLAAENMDRLPESVGLDIQSTGEFARMISRTEAVYWPLGLTLFCLLLMFCAKKPLLPWIISIFTLVMPVLIWLTNFYA